MTFKSTDRYIKAIEEIDKVNSKDITIETTDGKDNPKELLYSIRMTNMLNAYAPNANEPVHVAARGQHISRWSIPRTDYPLGKKGYHQWRRSLTQLHCELLSDILTKLNYSSEEIEYVNNLVQKKQIKKDPNSQILQDVVSLVFLKYYALEFMQKHEPAKSKDILKKMTRKMSENGISKATEICAPEIIKALKSI